MLDPTTYSIGAQATQQAAAKAALAYPPLFITRYFRDDKGKPLVMEEFHLDIIQALTDPSAKRVLILVPADHAKTTLTRFSAIREIVRDRNIRIMNIMNNATDAVQNCVAVEREISDPDSLLWEDYGDLRGDVWQTGQFTVAGRTSKDKEPTFAAYGTGSNVFGHRADLVLCDDLLNLENSGPQVTDEARRQLHDWFFQGVMKVAGPTGKIVVMGTVMDFRDLYHELMDPKHGFTVIRMKALDEATNEPLWPKRFSADFLLAEKASDLISFSKRRQNEALDTSLLTFERAAWDRCKDLTRGWGEITQAMKDAHETTVFVTFDPSAVQTSTTSWPAVCVGCFDPEAPLPRKLYVLELYRFRALLEETEANIARGRLGQVETLIDLCTRYNAQKLVIEANSTNAYVEQNVKLRQFAVDHLVEPHYTAGNKRDPVLGVASMGATANAMMFDLPYGDARSRKEIDDFLTTEIEPHPMGQCSDRLMALWFFQLKAYEESTRRFRVKYRTLPPWSAGRMPPPRLRVVA